MAAVSRPSKVVHTYFDLPARGFVSRVCFRKSGVAFEEKRLTFAEWPTLKSETPVKQLPVVQIDGGEYISQSTAISRYAAKLAGLYPTDALAALKADEVVSIVDDLWNAGGATPKDEAARVKYAKEVAPKFLDALAARLGKDKFFFGAAEPQWADLWMYQYVALFTSGFFDFIPKSFVADAAPTIAAHAEAVKASELYKQFGTPE